MSSLRLTAYLAWINAWVSTPWDHKHDAEPVMSVGEMAGFFRDENLLHLLHGDNLKKIITSFRHRVDAKEILLGGTVPPSCDETNILTHRYDPRTDCTCDGVYPVPPAATSESILQQNECRAVQKMVDMANLSAIAEFLLFNADEQGPPETCLGPMPSIAHIQAPDCRINPSCDTDLSVYHQLYPTNEQVKILTDAKYFFAIACGGGRCDEGISRAVAEAANNILIADYCEAADEKSLHLLQEVEAAAMTFLKLCNLAGVISDWQFDNNIAQTIQFGVLGYYRDHSRTRRPGGVYGSYMSSVLSHRYIDLAIYYTLISEACVLLNDLVDFRSDTMRKLRENFILRGIRGNICGYLDGLICSSLQVAAKAIESSPVCALVVMGVCNWALMASQHKVYEVFHGVRERKGAAVCEYASASNGSYKWLLNALKGYGTLGENGPDVAKRRVDMDMGFAAHRTSPQTNMAWLADSTRSMLHPGNLRRIIDIVHFE
ncbi:uncharacterized protein ASPGLDRAFT_68701 [Aspergillus glaucus CBS 516.65]|uniref:Uncharacterized protein n=1 Tax=Aspergillus glaucus CBS 516.65 TaxID=1160497 RepID=A0A1L9VBS7_ASPGL|nr:hypothetical protein ASPGLDRAFT_68701 [Aspergillus glaucus CBS 516.65]OJJ81391.1 hypothetical protein ASPGLDRAFT_68701 [Aspergillus glaucus CBS 516.65]